MQSLLWLLVVVNFLICAWDAYASGVIWEKATTLLEKLLAGSAFVMGYIGFFYTMILVGILVDLIPSVYLLPMNVFLGIPLIGTGIVITVHSVLQAWRSRSLGDILVAIWNTFAIIHDIRVWFRSVALLREIGGVKGMIEITSDLDDNKKVAIVLYTVVALVLTTLFMYGLHRAGREYALEH